MGQLVPLRPAPAEEVRGAQRGVLGMQEEQPEPRGGALHKPLTPPDP